MYYSYHEDDEGNSLYIFDIIEDNVKKKSKTGAQTGAICHFYIEYNTFSRDELYNTEKFISNGAPLRVTRKDVNSVISMRKLLDILFRKIK